MLIFWLDSKVAAYETEKLEVKDEILRELKGEIKVEMSYKFKDDIKNLREKTDTRLKGIMEALDRIVSGLKSDAKKK